MSVFYLKIACFFVPLRIRKKMSLRVVRASVKFKKLTNTFLRSGVFKILKNICLNLLVKGWNGRLKS